MKKVQMVLQCILIIGCGIISLVNAVQGESIHSLLWGITCIMNVITTVLIVKNDSADNDGNTDGSSDGENE